MPVRLDFRVVESTSQDDGFSHSNILEIGPQSKGWLSSKYSIYPQSLVLLLSTPAQIEQIQMLGNAWAVSTQIDIQVGEVARGSSRDRKNAHFMELGSVFPESNEQFDYNARQLITVEIADDGRPCPVSFIKLVFHKNYQNKKNQYNQVGLTAISIIGTPAGSDNTEGEFNLDQVLSPYDELSFLVYTDTEITQLILKLEKRKLDAAGTERFEYAKKIKEAIDELCLAGQNLATLQMEKNILAERQQYEEAKAKKDQIEQYRVEVYKSLEITDLLEIQGTNAVNDRRGLHEEGRVAKLSPLILRKPLDSADSGNKMNRSRSLPPVPKRDFLYGKDYVRERESKTPTPQISRSTTPIPEPIYRSPTPVRKWAEEQIEPTSIEYAEIDYEDTNQDQENDKYFQKQEKKKFSLDQKKVLKVALNLYGEDLIYDCLTKNVKIELRQTVLEEFKYKFEKNAEKGSKRKLVKGTHQVLVFLLKDKIASVFQTACDITCKLYQDVIDNSIDQSLLTSTTRELFSILMLRASENVPRVAEAALNTIHCIIKCEEVEHLSVLDDLLTEDIQQKSLAVVTSIRVDLVTFLITFYGISDDPKDSMSIRNLSKLSLGALEHTSSIVREAGQELVLLLYRKDPRIVRQTLEKVPGNRNIKKIIEIFDQIDSNKT